MASLLSSAVGHFAARTTSMPGLLLSHILHGTGSSASSIRTSVDHGGSHVSHKLGSLPDSGQPATGYLLIVY